MYDSSRIGRQLGRAPARPVHAVAASIAIVALTLLAACGGSPKSAASGGSTTAASSPSAVAYSACMRSHGVVNFPDPGSSGQVPKTDAQELGVSTSQYHGAQHACQDMLPTGGSAQQQDYQCMENSDCSPALVQQMMTADLKLAECMRIHGVPNFPDPTNDGPSGPIFNISRVGISDAASHSSQFVAELNECGRIAGANAPESFE